MVEDAPVVRQAQGAEVISPEAFRSRDAHLARSFATFGAITAAQ